MQIVSIADAKNVAVHGRTTACRAPLTLFWSASSIEMNLKGSEVWVEFETDYDQYEQWVSVVLNGAHIARFQLPKGRAWMPILRNLNPEKVHHIEIIRDVQAMPEDEKCCLQIHNLKIEGELLPIAEKALKLEVLGDSITSAEGAIGAQQEADWIATFFCATRGYAYLLAQELNADLRVLSESGWGALSSWDNDPKCALPKYYEQVCGVVKGEKNAALGAFECNDFDVWNADVVVINLGANDASAFHQPAHVDPATGDSFKQRMNADGTPNAEDVQQLKNAMYDALVKVRKYNPSAHILWVHGMLTNALSGVIAEVVEQYKKDTGDAKAHFFELPNEPTDGIGARNHPGLPMHKCATDALIARIRSL